MILVAGLPLSRQTLMCSLVFVSSLVFSSNCLSKVTGADIYEQTLETTSKYEDPILEQYITDLGEQVVAVSSMKGKKIHIYSA